MNTTTHHMHRRSFLKGVLAAGTFSIISPGSLLGQAKAKRDKVRTAFVGIGNQGEHVLWQFTNTGLVEVVALCDTEIGAKRTQKALSRHPNVPQFRDFRKMLDKLGNQIDAVVVCTPDFSHFPATIAAMALGKGVYVEKPMAHTVLQMERLMAAEKKYRVVTQMGNQGHSEANYFQFKAWAEAGIVKNVTRINAHMNNGRRWHWDEKGKEYFKDIAGYFPKEKTPDWIDWDGWLSVAAEHDFSQKYLNGEWRCWYDFGNGALGDWGAHIFDTAHEFLRLGLPKEIIPVKIEGHNPYVFPQATTLQFKFAARGPGLPACDLFWYDGKRNLPPEAKGGGDIEVDASIPPPGGVSSNNNTKAPSPGKEIYTSDGLTFQGGSHGSTLKILDKEKAAAMKLPEVPKSTSNHYKNFLLAVMGEEKVRSPFSVAGPLCETMALGVIAQRLNEKLVFDPKTKQITNSKVGNELLAGAPPRPGWEQFYKL